MVVDGLDLDVPAGEIVGLIGANGAGKTTTVECIQGLRSRTPGSSGCSATSAAPPAASAPAANAAGHRVRAGLDTLTSREREVLALIGRGKTNGEIAAELFVSEGTVKTHINHVFTKLQLRDRAAAVVFAFDHDLVARD